MPASARMFFLLALFTGCHGNKEAMAEIEFNMIFSRLSPSYASIPISRRMPNDQDPNAWVWSFYLFGENSDGNTGRLSVHGQRGHGGQALSDLSRVLNSNTEYKVRWAYNAKSGGQLFIDDEPMGQRVGGGQLLPHGQTRICTSNPYNGGGRPHTVFEGSVLIQRAIETLNNEKAEQERTIETLTNEKAEQQHVIGTLNNEKAEQERRIETLNNEQAEQQCVIETLNNEKASSTSTWAETVGDCRDADGKHSNYETPTGDLSFCKQKCHDDAKCDSFDAAASITAGGVTRCWLFDGTLRKHSGNGNPKSKCFVKNQASSTSTWAETVGDCRQQEADLEAQRKTAEAAEELTKELMKTNSIIRGQLIAKEKTEAELQDTMSQSSADLDTQRKRAEAAEGKTTTALEQLAAKLQKTEEDLQNAEGDLQKVKNEKRKLEEDSKKLLSEVLFSADKEKKGLSDKVFQAEAKIANLKERMQKTQDTDLKSKELLLEMLRSATKEKEELSGKMTKAEAQFKKYQEAYEKLYKGCAEFTTASTCPGQPRCLWTGTSCEVPKSQRDEFFLKCVAAIMIVVVCAAFVIKAFYPGAGALQPLGAASFVVLVFLAMLLANSEAVGLFLQVLGQAMAAVFQAWGVPPAPPR